MSNTKELEEAIMGLMNLSLVLFKHFKDGVQLHDAIGIIADLQGNAELRQSLVDAAMGCHKIPGEVKNMDFKDAMNLTSLSMSYVGKIIAEAQK